ncbi:MAG: hypothetical protein ACI9MR_000713 [Myxococcota bacterium]|jgi:uncharacterized protein (TIGR03382 family)
MRFGIAMIVVMMWAPSALADLAPEPLKTPKKDDSCAAVTGPSVPIALGVGLVGLISLQRRRRLDAPPSEHC